MSMESLYAKESAGMYDVCTRREGPQGQLPEWGGIPTTSRAGMS